MKYVFEKEFEIDCCEDCPMFTEVVEFEEWVSWCNLLQVEIKDEQNGKHILCNLREANCDNC